MIVQHNKVSFNVVSSASDKMVKGSVQKISLISRMITGYHVHDAVFTLKFLQKRVAKSMYVMLRSAIANAEETMSVDSDALYVCKVTVGKSVSMKRFHARGRGRASRINKPFSNITIYIGEKK